MKKNMLIILLFLIGAVLFPQESSLSRYITGERLYENWCEYLKVEGGSVDSLSMLKSAFFMGYVLGFIDTCYLATSFEITNQLTAEYRKENGLPDVNLADAIIGLEVPEHASLKQIFHIVGKYLTENPESWDRDASLLILLALQESFY